jgi:hypothetical protein
MKSKPGSNQTSGPPDTAFKKIPVPYEFHYHCRGGRLFNFNCQEYYALVGIKEKPQKKKTGTDDSRMDIGDNKGASLSKFILEEAFDTNVDKTTEESGLPKTGREGQVVSIWKGASFGTYPYAISQIKAAHPDIYRTRKAFSFRTPTPRKIGWSSYYGTAKRIHRDIQGLEAKG